MVDAQFRTDIPRQRGSQKAVPGAGLRIDAAPCR
jgi:hypothetical protein